jgi:hypothetical protein
MPRKRQRAVSAETLRKRNTAAQRERRSDSDYRAQEQAAQRARRSNPEFRAREQAADTAARRVRRCNSAIRAQEHAAQRTRKSYPAIRAPKLLSPKISPTTDEFTTIDAVFGKLGNYQAEVHPYESLASYHKPLVIRLKKNVTIE